MSTNWVTGKEKHAMETLTVSMATAVLTQLLPPHLGKYSMIREGLGCMQGEKSHVDAWQIHNYYLSTAVHFIFCARILPRKSRSITAK